MPVQHFGGFELGGGVRPSFHAVPDPISMMGHS